jgi:hypothetical protein
MHVATRASVLLFGVLLLVQLGWSRQSWGWTLDGHRLIALDALAVLPPPSRTSYPRAFMQSTYHRWALCCTDDCNSPDPSVCFDSRTQS